MKTAFEHYRDLDLLTEAPGQKPQALSGGRMSLPRPFRHTPRRPHAQKYVVLFSDDFVKDVPWNGRLMTLMQAIKLRLRLERSNYRFPSQTFSIGMVG